MTYEATEADLLRAIAVDPFDDGLIAALRALRRGDDRRGRSRDRLWEAGLKNILASTRGDESEYARREAVRAWAQDLEDNPDACPVEVSAGYEGEMDE